MIFKTSPVVAQANAIVSHSYESFLAEAKKQGWTSVLKLLNPTKEGKVPVVMLTGDGKENITMVLSKSGAEMLKKGEDIATSRILEGKNAKGEDRYYIAFANELEAIENEIKRTQQYKATRVATGMLKESI